MNLIIICNRLGGLIPTHQPAAGIAPAPPLRGEQADVHAGDGENLLRGSGPDHSAAGEGDPLVGGS
ncbi:hypothetical protein [Streptomyces sp. ST2-7A]|uniref:hypothetical protein n=1 Tax=Streptomyces sp. ST2-7A TaxID=2907214 RepID=UPI001F2E0550|nr:hypothetical protein [Streptomyces sp. ST2-7A]MCE7080336.1 hypothetical protein [Streptomyces sp. ST2-7A]